jgi:hypothetical protein
MAHLPLTGVLLWLPRAVLNTSGLTAEQNKLRIGSGTSPPVDLTTCSSGRLLARSKTIRRTWPT